MKRLTETFTPQEAARVIAAFDAEIVRPLPWHWLRDSDFDAANGDAHDNHRDGVRVLRSVDLYDDGHIWLHVSVSLRGRVKTGKGNPPGWYVMDAVKRVFIGDDRVAYQIHPKRTEHYSENETLHLWCPLDYEPIPDLRSPDGRL